MNVASYNIARITSPQFHYGSSFLHAVHECNSVQQQETIAVVEL